MNHREYEHHVARILDAEGWQTTVSRAVRDFGVDIIAERDGVRLGVQAKMYGGGRRISGRMIQEVFGAAAAADCDRSMIATDGRTLPDAQRMADKLGIEIRHVVAPQQQSDVDGEVAPLFFDEIWTTHVGALVGRTLVRANGDTNRIVAVDEGALVRISSNGRKQPIEVEVFRWAIERLLSGETVTQAEINTNCKVRASAGIMLILDALPMFQRTKHEGKPALRMVHSLRHTHAAP